MIALFGNSMIRNVDRIVGMKEEGSFIKCIDGRNSLRALMAD